jgi:hypothetical protein
LNETDVFNDYLLEHDDKMNDADIIVAIGHQGQLSQMTVAIQ